MALWGSLVGWWRGWGVNASGFECVCVYLCACGGWLGDVEGRQV